MVEINPSLTRSVANLARLELTDAEVEMFTRQLAEVLAYVEQLQAVDVGGVEPLMHPHELETPMREDVARPAPADAQGRPKVYGPAPEVVDAGFKVPRIL